MEAEQKQSEQAIEELIRAVGINNKQLANKQLATTNDIFAVLVEILAELKKLNTPSVEEKKVIVD